MPHHRSEPLYNLADFAIVGGTALLVLALGTVGRLRTATWCAAGRRPVSWTRPRLHSALTAATLTAGLVVLVSVGA